MLFTKTIHGLHNGVSQQMPEMRLDNQFDEQVNCIGTLARGLERRPQGFIADADDTLTTTGSPFVHSIVRDSTESYMLTFSDGASNTLVDVVRTDTGGLAAAGGKTVNISTDAQAYLDQGRTVAGASQRFTAVTLKDYTIIANKNRTVEVLGAASPDWSPFALVWVYAAPGGPNAITYQITINGTTFSVDSELTNTGDIAYLLHTQIYGATVSGGVVSSFVNDQSVLHITVLDTGGSPVDFTISVGDDYGNTALRLIKDKVNTEEDLPPSAGFTNRIEVGGLDETDEASYWVEYTSETSRWEECLAPSTPYMFKENSLPVILRRNADGTFDLKQASELGDFEWDDRTTGSEDSNPWPSFVGDQITSVFFYKNRLGFLTTSSVVFSRTNDFWNFWPKTSAQVLDSDPIDLQALSGSAKSLYQVAPLENVLLVLADSLQYAVRYDDGIFSPNTVSIDEWTAYPCHRDVRPARLLGSVYSFGRSGDFMQVREFPVQLDSVSNLTADVTNHAPKYLPVDTYHLAAWPEAGLLVAKPDTLDELYIYQVMWHGDQKAQSAWHKWTFDGTLYGVMAVDDKLYALAKFGDVHQLLKFEMALDYENEPDSHPMPGWDYFVPAQTDSYSWADGTLTVDVSRLMGSMRFLSGDFNLAVNGTEIDLASASWVGTATTTSNVLEVSTPEPQAVSDTSAVVYGVSFDSEIVLSPWYMTLEENKRSTTGSLMLRNLFVEMAGEDGVELTVSNDYRPDVVQRRSVSTTTSLPFAVHGDVRDQTVGLKLTGRGRVTSLSLEGYFQTRGRRL